MIQISSTDPSRSCLAVLLLVSLLALPAAAVAMGPGEDPGRVQFRGAAFPIAEEAGEVTIVVKRQRGSDGEVTVDYETSPGTATEGEDYEAAAGTLTWADGDRGDKSFTIPILDDDLDEGQETFAVRLLNPTGDVEIGAVSQTIVRIKPSDRADDDGDDDPGDDPGDDAEAGTLQLVSAAFPAFESTGEATFLVERVDGTEGEVGVDFTTIAGSATSGEDYIDIAGTLTWADGEGGEKAVTVELIDDTEAEELETITVVLTLATGGADLGGRDVASIVIVDDDAGDGLCVPDDTTLCLRSGRFQLTGTWTDFDGNQGPFHAVPVSGETGLFWFFDDANLELLVKVLEGCPLNGNYWVFFAATTNVGFTMEVTDLESGLTRIYENPLGTIPLATTDVTAFACD